MPIQEKPTVINVLNGNNAVDIFSTGSKEKQAEITRIVERKVVFIENLKIDEVQSRDRFEVAEKKAKTAWEANGYSPVIIEDISLEITALEHLLPSTYTNEWSRHNESRTLICNVLQDDRRAAAHAIYAVFDGSEVHFRHGVIHGTIAQHPLGTNGFGWDDIFIPLTQHKTFAEMTSEEKDLFSMRRIALEKIKNDPFKIGKYIFQLVEPYQDEIVRVRTEELATNEAALQFAYNTEAFHGISPHVDLKADTYSPIHLEVIHHAGVPFYRRYIVDPNSSSLGLLLTNFIAFEIKREPNGDPIIWQMGPQRRKLAIAQRTEYFLTNQSERIHAQIDELEAETDPIPPRSNKKIPAIERALAIQDENPTETKSLDEIGYRKRSVERRMSRSVESAGNLLHKIGKYHRRIIGAGSMPTCIGSPDVLTTMALGHMVSFIPRNSRYAGHPDRQISLFNDAVRKITSLSIPNKWKERAIRNIGVSIGVDNPESVVKDAQLLYDAGVRLFRIYTINADPQVIETARLMRERFGNEIELFVGQVADDVQARSLVAQDIRADCIILGHGGGGQCTSAENGMAVTTLEELYEMIRDPVLNTTSIAVEGSVGRNIGTYLLAGIDLLLFNQRIVRAGLENPAGELYFEHIKSTEQNPIYVQPNPGEASPETQTIEAVTESLTQKRVSSSGRTKGPEGKSGFMYFGKKAGGSMVFWINGLLSDASRMFADRGYKTMRELRQDAKSTDDAVKALRIVSPAARYTGSAHAA